MKWMPTSRVRFKNGPTAEIQADNSVRHCLSNVSSRSWKAGFPRASGTTPDQTGTTDGGVP